MNNIAELVIRSDRNPERLHQAEQWARRGLAKIETTRKGSMVPIPTCELALTAALFNNGAITEYQGNKEEAKVLYERSLDQAEHIDMKEGISVAREALARMEQGLEPPPPMKPQPPPQAPRRNAAEGGGWFSWLRN